MLQMVFTEAEREALHYERFHHPHPRVQQRMEAVLLKSHGLPHSVIASVLRVQEGTVREYLRGYQEGGIDKLKDLNWHGSSSALSAYSDTLKNFFCNIRRRVWPRRAPRSPN